MNCDESFSLFFPVYVSSPMFSVLRYGAGSTLRLDWPENVLVAECGTPAQEPLTDPISGVAAALAEPLDYPPLRRAMTPADRVVLALGQGVPRADEVVAAAIGCLIRSGVDPAGVTVLRTQQDAARGLPDPFRLLPAPLGRQVTLATHDPRNQEGLAYLAASDRGNAILLNRAIVDADVVLPIGCLGNHGTAIDRGIHGAVFPALSDEKTLRRFRSAECHDARRPRKNSRVQESDEVGWLLGLNFTIQLVPGAGEEALHVLAGHFAAVRRRGAELYEAAWSWAVPRRASLVVAAIEGTAPHQTWQDVGRALAAAVPLVEDGGAIALCCELTEEPGPAVRHLADSPSRQAAVQQIRDECPDDALAAVQLAAAMEQADVYLLSRLDESLVEQLQMAPLAKPQEVVRLARRFDSCIVLGNAHRARVTVVED